MDHKHFNDEEKGTHLHQEYQSQSELDQHVDVTDAAQAGHVATDAMGHALVEIDQKASDRLSIKMDLHIIPIVAIQYLFAFIDRANIGKSSF